MGGACHNIGKSRPITLMLGLPLAGALLSGCSPMSRQILYKPDTPPPVVQIAPLPPSMVTAHTQDGLSLKGYYWAGADDDQDVIIVFHGRNWTANRSANAARHLAGAGNAVLVASYRGFDDNPGTPDQPGLIADAEAFIRLAKQISGPDSRIWLVGHSLGSAVALHASGANPQINGLFLLSPFARITDVAPSIARPFIPDEWDNLIALPPQQRPVIIMQGGLDRFIPSVSADDLFAASTGPASLIVGEQSRHNPDMETLSPWISAAITSARTGSLAALPPPPPGWVEKIRRP